MGCDIHMTLEKKEGGEFVKVRELSPYDDRDYYLFSILGNVRNSLGFKPISDNRGVPDDASLSYLGRVEDWIDYGHSHNYLTLQEILDYDYEQEIILTGYTSGIGIEKIRVGQLPDMYWGLGNGKHFESIAEYEEFMKTNPHFSGHFDVRFEHKQTYRETIEYFLTEYVEKWKEYCDNGKISYSDFRICFFFDN